MANTLTVLLLAWYGTLLTITCVGLLAVVASAVHELAPRVPVPTKPPPSTPSRMQLNSTAASQPPNSTAATLRVLGEAPFAVLGSEPEVGSFLGDIACCETSTAYLSTSPEPLLGSVVANASSCGARCRAAHDCQAFTTRKNYGGQNYSNACT